jgi:hypothetical protein
MNRENGDDDKTTQTMIEARGSIFERKKIESNGAPKVAVDERGKG